MMTDAPSTVSDAQLDEVHLDVRKTESNEEN